MPASGTITFQFNNSFQTRTIFVQNDTLDEWSPTLQQAAIHSLRVSDGNLYSYTHGDGQVKGFVWPDRRDDRLYFTTVNNVHGVRDDGTAITRAVVADQRAEPVDPAAEGRAPTTCTWGTASGRLLQIDVVSPTDHAVSSSTRERCRSGRRAWTTSTASCSWGRARA